MVTARTTTMHFGASLILGMALALIISAWASSQARAQTSITITPSLAELEATPGSSGQHKITVSNSGDEVFSGTASVNGYPGVRDDDLSAERFLDISSERITLKPGEERQVSVDMRIPEDVKSGGRYAAIEFVTDAKADSPTGGSGTATSGKIVVPLLFTIQGSEPLPKDADVSIVPQLLEDGTVGFEVEVDNTGNIHFVPEGKLEVASGDDNPVETLEVPTGTPVIPGTTEPLGVDGSLPADAKEYTARASVDYGGEKPATEELTFKPDARLAIEELGVEDRPGESPNLHLALANEGGLAIDPQVRFDVFNSGGRVGATAPGYQVETEPAGRTEVETEYPGQLGPGKYVLQATILYGDAQELAKQTTFTLKGAAQEAQQPGAPEVPVGSVGPNWLLIVGAPLGVMLLLIVTIFSLPPVRRRIKRAWTAFSHSE